MSLKKHSVSHPAKKSSPAMILGVLLLVLGLSVALFQLQHQQVGNTRAAVAYYTMPPMLNPGCQFFTSPSITPAFCDTFDAPSSGGRGGALDPKKWAFGRETKRAGQGFPAESADEFLPTNAMKCKTVTQGAVTPDGDSFFCGQEVPEPEHWMTAYNDGADDLGYGNIAGRIRQPFDFAGRTGTIVFDVDAGVGYPPAYWPEVWITADQAPIPHEVDELPSSPKNGIGFIFEKQSDQCGDTNQAGGLSAMYVVTNYAQQEITFTSDPNGEGDCVLTNYDMASHFELKISQNRVEVWGSDYSPDHGITIPHFHRMAYANVSLPFTRGYVTFEQSQQNAEKFNNIMPEHTFHWHNIGFDGPVLPRERAYEVPDAMQSANDSWHGINVGYYVEPDTSSPNNRVFTLNNVDTTNATDAEVTLSIHNWSATSGSSNFKYRLNGGTWHTFIYPQADAGKNGGWTWAGFSLPVPLTDLKQGTNTLQFGSATDEYVIANVDLVVNGSFQTISPANYAVPHHFITLSGTSISPQSQTVNAGEMVTWTNTSTQSLSTISDVQSNIDSWNSGTMVTQESYSHVFTQPGTYTYKVGSVAGTIVVQATSTTYPPMQIPIQTVTTINTSSLSQPTITINQGDSVMWTNATSKLQEVTSTDTENLFDSGNSLQPGKQFFLTFGSAGKFTYKVGSLTGTIIVQTGPGTPTPTITPNPSATVAPTPTGGVVQNTVNIVDFGFSPANIIVHQGDIVTWTNTSTSVPHTVTSSTGLFDSGVLTAGQTFSYKFTQTGTFNYSCTIHPAMVGSVTVLPVGTNPSNTPTPTPTAQPTNTPVPTTTTAPGSIVLSFPSILLHGLGKAGDSVNPGASGGGNMTPLHPSRTLTVYLYNGSAQLVATKTGTITYQSSTGDFKGSVDLGTAFTSGTYTVKVSTPGYLTLQVPGFYTIAQSQTAQLPQISMIVGDADADNKLDILDYNELIGCYSDLAPATNCPGNNKTATDFSDDGNVNQIDYNLFLRELSVRIGQ